MSRPIRIAVASGKGGTGKTTIATNLALALAGIGTRVAYVDCDVEEPNGHIFLKPTIQRSQPVSIPVPEVDLARCTLCGACGKACRYSAILALPKKVLTFPNLCHGCGGCLLACPDDAIREVPRITGIVEAGVSGQVTFLHGKLNVGEAMAPPVIRAVLQAASAEFAPRAGDCTLVLDAPPGTSCPVIESIKTADVVLLVTEPTPFGLNDLKLAVEMVRQLGLPFGVIVNRVGTGDSAVFDYCRSEQIAVLLELPNDRTIAQAYSRGEPALTALPHLRPLFLDLFQKVIELAHATPRPRMEPRPTATLTGGEPDAPPHVARFAPHSREAPPLRALPSATMPPGRNENVRELVVISGKGGTGKTSIVASFFALAGQATVADCDVDAADLHLVLDPTVRHRWPFSGGKTAVIDAELCTGCGVCAQHCRFDAIRVPHHANTATHEVDPVACEGCGVCVDTCPEQAVSLCSSINGEWFVSDTRHGPMAHARLGIAQENSGKLVTVVRREARALSSSAGRTRSGGAPLGCGAERARCDCELLICDGSPGIGCPVIASIAGAHMALIVTEPTLSGLHDLQRVAELCHQFNTRAGVCINKADINVEISDRIEAQAETMGLPVLGRVRYDDSVTTAQVRRLSVVEHGEGPAATDIRALWERVKHSIT